MGKTMVLLNFLGLLVALPLASAIECSLCDNGGACGLCQGATLANRPRDHQR